MENVIIATLVSKVISLPFIFICLTVHEFSHGFMAYRLGDTTAKEAGRLTLNPISHIDWLGVLAMLFLGFGWAKPVPVNPYRFKKAGARGIVWVSLAGPVSNILFAFLTLIVWNVLVLFAGDIAANYYVSTIISTIVSLNIGLAVFNLIPIPPLDGSKVLEYFLPYSARSWMAKNGNVLYLIMMLAVFSGVFSRIISPAIGLIFTLLYRCARFIIFLFV